MVVMGCEVVIVVVVVMVVIVVAGMVHGGSGNK